MFFSALESSRSCIKERGQVNLTFLITSKICSMLIMSIWSILTLGNVIGGEIRNVIGVKFVSLMFLL